MAFLGIYGAHATGKTTAMQRWWEQLWPPTQNYPRASHDIDADITFIFGDTSNAEYRYDHGVKSIKERTPGRSPWQSDAETKRNLIRDCVADDMRLYVVESVRFDNHLAIANAYQEYNGGAHIVLITTNWKLLKSYLQQRCEGRSRSYNDAYWTLGKLEYESRRRYTGLAAKSLRPAGVPYTTFEVDETRDWSKIDVFIWDVLDRPMEVWYK